MRFQWLRLLSLSLLTAGGLVGSFWTIRIQTEFGSIVKTTNNDHPINKERMSATFKGSKKFQEFASSTGQPARSKITSSSSSCEKWAVLTIADDSTWLPVEDFPPLLPMLNRSKPNNSWCIVLALMSTKSQKLIGRIVNDESIHIVSLSDQMKERSDTYSDFVRAMKSSGDQESACRNVGYLYALQQRARYLLDLEITTNMKDLWTSVEQTYFVNNDDSLTVEVPLLGDAKILNPHAYIFNETSLGSSWPRGYPRTFDHPRQSSKVALVKRIQKDRVGVIHQLSQVPDLDSQGLLMIGGGDKINVEDDDVNYSFSTRKRNPLLVPSHTFVPYNTKATLHTPETLWATLLPTSLICDHQSQGISDIWRSFITQVLLQPLQLQVVVVPPPPTSSTKKVESHHHAPKEGGVTQPAESQLKSDMVHYSHGRSLLQYLDQYSKSLNSNNDSLPKRMEDLWIHLYEHGFLGIDDVTVMQLWLQTLTENNWYTFSMPQQQQHPYFKNVVLMGQFNYVSYPKHIPTNLSPQAVEQLAQRSMEDARVVPSDQNSNQLDLVIQEDSIELVAFWVQKWRDVFQHIVVRGPFIQRQVTDLRLLYGIEAKGINDSRWNHTVNDNGYYSPISNLMQTLGEYKDNPDIDGVIYLHDDMFLDISDLIQPQFSTGMASLSRFPSDAILASGQGSRKSYFNPRSSSNKESASTRSYTIDSRGRFTKLDGQSFGSDQDGLIQSLENWPWHRTHCIPRLAELAKDARVDPFREKEGNHAGSILVPPQEPSDFLFVPMQHAEMFIEVATLFVENRVFLECALPTIVDMLRQHAGAEVTTRDLCTSWDEESRNKKSMITACKNAKTGQPRKFGMYHPYKLSNGLMSWDTMFDLVTFAGSPALLQNTSVAKSSGFYSSSSNHNATGRF